MRDQERELRRGRKCTACSSHAWPPWRRTGGRAMLILDSRAPAPRRAPGRAALLYRAHAAAATAASLSVAGDLCRRDGRQGASDEGKLAHQLPRGRGLDWVSGPSISSRATQSMDAIPAATRPSTAATAPAPHRPRQRRTQQPHRGRAGDRIQPRQYSDGSGPSWAPKPVLRRRPSRHRAVPPPIPSDRKPGPRRGLCLGKPQPRFNTG